MESVSIRVTQRNTWAQRWLLMRTTIAISRCIVRHIRSSAYDYNLTAQLITDGLGDQSAGVDRHVYK